MHPGHRAPAVTPSSDPSPAVPSSSPVGARRLPVLALPAAGLGGWRLPAVSTIDWMQPLVAAGAAVLAGLVAWAVGRILRRLGRRRRMAVLASLHARAHRAFIAVAMSVAVLVSTDPTVSDVATSDTAGGWRRWVVIAVIATTCWLLIAALGVVEDVIQVRLPLDSESVPENNGRRRRARTQILLLRRVAVAVVVLLGLSAGLMSFPGLRTFGASLLASAGLAGVVAGLAAQTTLGNVFAGLQLAFTDALRVDDVVAVQKELGRIEDITLSYVVLRTWDERRLVLPTSHFTTQPFENWTRTHSQVLGSVLLHLDYRAPVDQVRARAREVIEASPRWDRREWGLQVVDTTESTMVVRVLASAQDAASAWDLRCDIREELIRWLRETHPEALPTHRSLVDAESPVTSEALVALPTY